MNKATLNPSPTEQDLLDYLKCFVKGEKIQYNDGGTIISENDLFGKKEPWEIFDETNSKETQYFFSPLKKRTGGSSIFKRDVGEGDGSWLQQRSKRPIYDLGNSQLIIGYWRSFSYENPGSSHHQLWLMKEYRLADYMSQEKEKHKACALCVVTRKTQTEDILNNQALDAADLEIIDKQNDYGTEDDMVESSSDAYDSGWENDCRSRSEDDMTDSSSDGQDSGSEDDTADMSSHGQDSGIENDSGSDMATSRSDAEDSPNLNIVHIGTKTVALQLLKGSKAYRKLRIEFPVTAYAISPDGTEAVLCGEDGKLHIYSVIGKNGLQKEVDVRKAPVFTSIFYSADGSKIVAWCKRC
ncbi:hypothetical protein ACH5RR_008523 [Cinchona calisaya]|uniref:NAC domain-containing protein n=1 Tax=Cinchona calisaya TaxID=153742 RepID=A0ABD3ABL0_9GENT